MHNRNFGRFSLQIFKAVCRYFFLAGVEATFFLETDFFVAVAFFAVGFLEEVFFGAAFVCADFFSEVDFDFGAEAFFDEDFAAPCLAEFFFGEFFVVDFFATVFSETFFDTEFFTVVFSESFFCFADFFKTVFLLSSALIAASASAWIFSKSYASSSTFFLNNIFSSFCAPCVLFDEFFASPFTEITSAGLFGISIVFSESEIFEGDFEARPSRMRR